jgi:hypothetical protein
MARKRILQIAQLKNELRELGISIHEDQIATGYAQWFCSQKYNLELCENEQVVYNALSKFGDKVQIKSRIGVDIDFNITFDDIWINEIDYLLIVFLNENTWMIDSIYKVPRDVVEEFRIIGIETSFKWCRESRSLSMQMFPDEENTIVL